MWGGRGKADQAAGAVIGSDSGLHLACFVATKTGAKGLLSTAISAGRCNTSVKSLCRGFKLQGLSWSFVELTCHLVQMRLRV